MPGINTPAQMFDNELNPRKGWPSQSAVDKSLPIWIEDDNRFGQASTFQQDICSGMVVHIARDGDGVDKFRLGLNDDNVAIFLFPNAKDFDVSGDRGNIIGSGSASVAAAAFNGAIAGNISGLVALGAYELETTSFLPGNAYLPGTPLTALNPNVAWNADATLNPGLVRNTTWAAWRAGTIAGVIGTVSDEGVRTNEFGKTVIRFWPEHLPCPTRN